MDYGIEFMCSPAVLWLSSIHEATDKPSDSFHSVMWAGRALQAEFSPVQVWRNIDAYVQSISDSFSSKTITVCKAEAPQEDRTDQQFSHSNFDHL